MIGYYTTAGTVVEATEPTLVRQYQSAEIARFKRIATNAGIELQ